MFVNYILDSYLLTADITRDSPATHRPLSAANSQQESGFHTYKCASRIRICLEAYIVSECRIGEGKELGGRVSRLMVAGRLPWVGRLWRLINGGGVVARQHLPLRKFDTWHEMIPRTSQSGRMSATHDGRMIAIHNFKTARLPPVHVLGA